MQVRCTLPHSCQRSARSRYSDGSVSSRSYGRSRHGERNAEALHDLRLQGLRTNQLPDAGLDTVETAEDEHGPADPRRLPTGHGLELSQDLGKAISQVGDHVIVTSYGTNAIGSAATNGVGSIRGRGGWAGGGAGAERARTTFAVRGTGPAMGRAGQPMGRVQGGGCTPDQHSLRNDALQPRRRREQALPVGSALSARRHSAPRTGAAGSADQPPERRRRGGHAP